MKVFLTGATGFIGSHVARLLLKSGCDVLASALPTDSTWRLLDIEHQLTLLRHDLSDPDSYQSTLVKWKPDACIHLAWYAEPGKYLQSPENLASLNASLTLLKALIEVGCRQVVMAGTCAEYDTSIGYLREDSPTRPETIYAASKLAMNLVGQQLALNTGINFVWARFFYLYGPYEDKRRVVPALINSLLKQEPFLATYGEQVRDYLHVEDVANALWTLTEQPASGIFNISSGIPITVRQLMETIGDILGHTELIRFGGVPYRDWEPLFICGANQRLRELGWSPRYTLREGLEQMVRWQRHQA